MHLFGNFDKSQKVKTFTQYLKFTTSINFKKLLSTLLFFYFIPKFCDKNMVLRGAINFFEKDIDNFLKALEDLTKTFNRPLKVP